MFKYFFHFLLQSSLQFGEIVFWRGRRENLWAPPLFSPPPPLNQTVKNVIFHPIFHPYFHPNQTYPQGRGGYGWIGYEFDMDGGFGVLVLLGSAFFFFSLYYDAMILANDRLIWVLIEVDLGLFIYLFILNMVFVPMGFWWAWWRHSGGDWAVEVWC